MPTLDIDFVRAQFPGLSHPESAGWAHLENAGGSYVPSHVIDLIQHFFTATKVQPYWDFPASAMGGEAMDLAKRRLPATFNADPDEVHFGPSTTQNTYVLAHAFGSAMSPGDEVIVTNQDHEANIGAWRRLAQLGITVKEWQVDPATGLLDISGLGGLLSERTQLVAVTHASNVAATINPISAISEAVHAVGAKLVVDGVSFAPHAAVDVAALGCDVYLYSAYKTFGPHVGMMYVAREHLVDIANQGHYFNEDVLNYRLVPAGADHAEVAATAGVMAYYDAVHAHHFAEAPADDVRLVADVFDLFGAHEQALMTPLVTFLNGRDGLHLVGSRSAQHADRAPTLAFWSDRASSAAIYRALIEAGVSCGHGHFYALRLLGALGLDPDDGVVRLSMVHYNTHEDVARALEVLDSIV